MNRALPFAIVAILAALTLARGVSAQVSIHPVRGCVGEVVIDGRTGAQRWSAVPARPLAVTTVYDNLDSPENFGVSSQDRTAVWGDSVITTGIGTIESISFTVFNGGSALQAIHGAQLRVRFRDAATDQILATATYDASFPAGLPGGYYTIVTLNTPGVPLALETTTLVIDQMMTVAPEEPQDLGIVSFAPVVVGSSPASMYTSFPTEWGGPGFITVPGYAANPGYRVKLDVASAVTATSWGRVKHLYR